MGERRQKHKGSEDAEFGDKNEETDEKRKHLVTKMTGVSGDCRSGRGYVGY